MRTLLFLLLFLPAWCVGQVYWLDEQFFGAPSVPASLDVTGSSFGSASSISNYGRNAPSFSLNTTGQQLRYGPWGGPADHISFFHKGTSGAGSTILVEESADGSTWTVVGTCTAITTSATWDADLLPDSRYVRLTFTKQSTCNVHIDDLRIRNAMNGCMDNIQILQLLINGGCGTCEGSEEFLYFDTGGQPFDIRYMELVSQTVTAGGNAYGGNGSGDNQNTNWVLSGNYTALQTAYIDNLNLWAGCSGVFIPVPSNNVIPANARVIAFTGATPTAPYNFADLCSIGTVYVIFADQVHCGGKYSNSSCSSNCTRYVTLFNHLSGCIDNQQYFANSVATAAGNGYIFVGDAIGYTSTASCSFLLLDVDFLAVHAERSGADAQIAWTTAGEEGLVSYTIERSADGLHFSPIGQAVARNDVSATYAFVDEQAPVGVAYYRIVAWDENGEPAVSPTAVLPAAEGHWMMQVRERELLVRAPEEGRYRIRIFTSTGQLVFDAAPILGPEIRSLSLPVSASGILLVTADGHAGHWTNRVIAE